MYLEKLIIDGFKSIGNKTEIDFINGKNIIMGPNGSGKSNVFECIEWILGGKSAKQLRASNMEGVIFNGGEIGKPANYAEGTLIFNNEDKELPLNSDKVIITRKLVRGKDNEYFINGELVKLGYIKTLFLNKGIGKNNYAITGQNKITEFIMAKPEDVRGIIEEAAGISGFKAKKNELINSITNYDKDLETVNAVISEIARNLKPLKKQIKNAEIYQNLKDELDKKKLFYYKTNIDILSTKETNLSDDLFNLNKQKEELYDEKTNLENFINDFDTKSPSLNSNIENLEAKKSNMEAILNDLDKEKVLKENNLSNLKEKRENMIKNIENLEKASNVEETEKQNLFNSIKNISAEIKNLEEDIARIDNEINNQKESINSIEQNLIMLNNSITDYKLVVQGKEKDKEILNTNVLSLDKDIKDNKNIVLELNNKKENLENNIKNNNDEIKNIEKKVNDYHNIESQLKSIDNIMNVTKKVEGKKNRTLEIKELIKNVKGFNDVLFNIISFDSKYEIAIDTLFGGILHNFIVDDVDSANLCIDILKKKKIPPVNFIILSKIKKYKEKDVVLLEKSENVFDIVKYNDKYKNLIFNYFGNNFISKDNKTAEAVWDSCSQKHRICTLDGILYSSNIIRGGYIQKDMNKLKKDYEKLISEKDDILIYNNEKLSNIYELKNKATLIEKDNETLTNKISELSKNNNKYTDIDLSLKKQLKENRDKLSIIEKEISKTNTLLDTSNKNISDGNAKICDLKANLDNLINEREDILLNKSKKSALLEEYEKNFYVYKNSSQEKIKSLKNNVDIVADQIDILNNELNKLISDIENKKEDLNSLVKVLKADKNKFDELRKDKDVKYSNLNSLISNISKVENDITKMEYSLNNIKENIEKCRVGLDEVPSEVEFTNFDKTLEDIFKDIDELEKKIKSLGFINTEALDEYKELNTRYETMTSNKKDLEESKGKILVVLQKMQDDMVSKYIGCFNSLQENFNQIFNKLFNGGKAEIIIENETVPLESGVIIKATPPGKKNCDIYSLSGGEKTMAAVSFIFALLKYNPSPLVIFDEIDAALDEINVSLIADYIKNDKGVQYIIVSHRKPMMKMADVLYGASMNKGITELISKKLI